MAIQLKRGTAAEWTTANTVLVVGQPGIETDTRKWKVGDGTTAWNSLDYMLGGSSGTSVRSGFATLVSGEAVIGVSWVTADTIVTALRQAPPATSGKQLYCDQADHVPGTSFTIKSEDATDAGLIMWMATEPTDNPFAESGMVLQSDAGVGMAYIERDIGSTPNELWVTFDVAFAAAALTYWDGSTFGSGYLASTLNSVAEGYTEMIAWFIQNDLSWENGGVGGGSEASPAPVADAWQTIEYHYVESTATFELYIGGSLVHTHSGSPAPELNPQFVRIGQIFADNDPSEIVFYKNVKIGSTRGGTEFLGENFGGDLSAWAVTGDCTIVADPY